MARNRRPQRIRGRLTVARSQSNAQSFFRTQVIAEDGAMAFFSAKDRKTIWLAGINAAAVLLMRKFLPTRFTEKVRQAPWFYRGGTKDANPRPLVSSGLLRTMVTRGADIRLSGTSTNASARVGFPVTIYARRNRDIMRALESISYAESDQMAEAMAAEMVTMLTGATSNRRGRARLAQGQGISSSLGGA